MLSQKLSKVQASATLAIDAKLKAMQAQNIDVVGFGAGEPDFDTPDNVKMAAVQAISRGHTKYTPAAGIMDLRAAIAEKLKRDNDLDYQPTDIVVSNGAKHSLYNAFSVLLNPGDEVIIPSPYWVSYPEMVQVADGVPVFLHAGEEAGFKFTADQLKAAITPKSKVLLLNSPSNPTGMIYTKDELQAIADVCVAHNLYVISDEIYEDLIYDGKQHVSIASLGSEIKERTIVVNGFSKSSSMTGWRVGYTASSSEIAKIMGNVQSHLTSNPCSISQYAALEALKNPNGFSKRMAEEFAKRRNHMHSELNAIPGISAPMPDGAFYLLMNISSFIGKTIAGVEIKSSMEFCEVLLTEAKVALVPGKPFGIDNYCRLSYCTSMDTINKGIQRIKEFAEKYN